VCAPGVLTQSSNCQTGPHASYLLGLTRVFYESAREAARQGRWLIRAPFRQRPVAEPGAELRQQCQEHKKDYQLGAFDQSRRVVDELSTAVLERCAGGLLRAALPITH
jgi:hypothetical protein